MLYKFCSTFLCESSYLLLLLWWVSARRMQMGLCDILQPSKESAHGKPRHWRWQKQAQWRHENFKTGSAKGPDMSSPKSHSLIRFSKSRFTKDRHHYITILKSHVVLNTPHEPGSVRGGSEESLVRLLGNQTVPLIHYLTRSCGRKCPTATLSEKVEVSRVPHLHSEKPDAFPIIEKCVSWLAMYTQVSHLCAWSKLPSSAHLDED